MEEKQHNSMRKVKLYEEFIGEAASAEAAPAPASAKPRTNPLRRKQTAVAEVVHTEEVQIPAKLANAITEAVELNQKLTTMINEFNAQIKPLQNKLSEDERIVLEALSDGSKQSIKVGKILATIKETKGKTTVKYKEVLEGIVPKLNKKQNEILDKLVETATTTHPNKKEVNFEVAESKLHEGLLDAIKEFFSYMKAQIKKLAKPVMEYNAITDELISASEKEGII